MANLRFTMNALCAPLSVSVPCVTMWPSLRRSAGANERSLLTHKLVQRLGADQLLDEVGRIDMFDFLLSLKVLNRMELQPK